jgi:acetoin utilization protein AcuC
MKTGFYYTDAYVDFDYGPMHPLKVIRLKLTYDLIRAYGLLNLPSVRFFPTQKATDEDLATFHSRKYLHVLRQANDGRKEGNAYAYGLGPGDNPIFPGFYDWSLWVTGATLQAVDFVADGEGEIAFNIAGGLHHAHHSRASGFCYVNDAVVGILRLLEKGKRVAYLDLDAHHGDGVQKAFYQTNQVMTISLHETGNSLFPGTGFEYEIGEEEGKGYSVNLPFPPYTDDDVYLWAFEEVVPPLIQAFQPDVLVTQLGVDTFENDPLTNLSLSIHGFEKVVRRIKDLSVKWVALGGGGYEVSNVARAWTLAWAVMNGVELRNELPEVFLEEAGRLGIFERELRGASPKPASENQRREVRSETERIVNQVKKIIFPLLLYRK